MCGICGIRNYRDGSPVDHELLARMTESIRHRGPDEDGFLREGDLGLGVRRLSIIDLAGGSQPIWNEDATVGLVFNGEIYDYRRLRSDLEARGHRFRTKADTETVVHAYEEWDLECFQQLNGMFGLALWDRTRRRLVLARDQHGVKPLYYADSGHSLRFGSEVRAIFADPEVPRQADLGHLDQYLAFGYVVSPGTAFAGVRKLPPGHLLVCDEVGVGVQRYNRRRPTLAPLSEPEAVGAVRTALEAAVARQMVADVPVGVMLSGGLDSSLVATIMSRLAGGPIQTFTVGFEGSFQDNELHHGRRVADRIGASHHELVISEREYADFLPASIEILEEPVATSSTLALHRLSRLAREQVKVALSGQGADEPFAGYPRYLGERYGGVYRKVPSPLRHRLIQPAIARLPRAEQLKRAARSLGTPDVPRRMADIYTILDPAIRAELYRGDLAVEDWSPVFAAWQADVATRDPLSRMLYVDARTSLSDNLLLYADKVSMANSLELRVPFLDLDLVGLVESLPAALKIRGRRQKHVLKAAAAAWLPADEIDRRKVGFNTPFDRWLRGDLGAQLADLAASADSVTALYLNRPVVERLIAEHQRGRHDHKRALFALLTLELWHARCIQRAGAAVPA